jgi:predicted site-specific integrase-resolvase
MDRSPMLSPGEVAHLLAVNPKTVSRWCREGRLASFRTPGGPVDAVLALSGDMGVDENAARKLLT